MGLERANAILGSVALRVSAMQSRLTAQGEVLSIPQLVVSGLGSEV